MEETRVTLATPEVLLPVLAIEEAVNRRQNFNLYISKPALKKPGAEKLATFFGLTVVLHLVMSIYDWLGSEHGGQPFFAFSYHAHVSRQGLYLSEADGHCNSWESRYRWRWLSPEALPPGYDTSQLFRREATIEEFEFAIRRKETGGQYGKPAEYWARFEEAIRNGTARHGMKSTADNRSFPSVIVPSIQYRIPNPDPYDAVNSCMKIAHKRAYVAAVLIATNASDYFSQDLEDDIVVPVPPPPPAPEPPPPPPPPRSAPRPPAAPPEEEIAPELAAIYQRMAAGSRDQRLHEFSQLKAALRELHGDEEGEALYYRILGEHGVQHASSFTGLTAARKAIASLFGAVTEGAEARA